jgi:hypothetical protein
VNVGDVIAAGAIAFVPSVGTGLFAVAGDVSPSRWWWRRPLALGLIVWLVLTVNIGLVLL